MSPRVKQFLWFHSYAILAFGSYVAFFFALYPAMGGSVAIFSFVPVLLVAWLRGVRRGIIAAILANIIVLALFKVVGIKSWDAVSLMQRLPGFIAVILIAIIVGYMRELRERVKKELWKKEKVETALRESEARFKAIYEGANDAIMLFSEKSFFDCNQRTLEMFGFKNKEEFCGIHPAGISPSHQPDGKESFPAAQERIREAFRLGSCRFEWIHRHTSGENFPTEVLLSAFALKDKRVLQATVRDITHRKKAEQALAESENSFRKMFEITSEGVALVCPETNRFVAANPAMSAIFGYSEDEFHQLTPEDITPPESKTIMRQSMQILTNGDVIPEHEGTGLCKNGSLVNVIVSNRHMQWKGNPVFHITFKNITFIKTIQEQLRKKNSEILEFTDMVTHDLKKPLTTVKIVLEMARKGSLGTLNTEALEAMDSGLEASQYMQELLNDLLVCARLESGTAVLDIQKVKCADIVAVVLDKLKYQIEEKKISITTDGLDVDLFVDAKSLTRILMNLIGNTVTYIGEGSGRQIAISLAQHSDSVELCIKDNGIGIPVESQKTLFQKFKRGTNVSGISGTGLGLFIVKETVQAHGGKIRFESKEGEGTTFFITLPNRLS